MRHSLTKSSDTVALILLMIALGALVVAGLTHASKEIERERQRLDLARREGMTMMVEQKVRYTEKCFRHKFKLTGSFGCFMCKTKYRTNIVEVMRKAP